MEYSAEVSNICSIFTEYRNTINIYTEDEEKDKKFYVKLLTRLLEGTDIKISDVHPIGNCKEVAKACAADTSSYPKIYIVDGDIDLMTTPKASCDHLFILDRYCIENFVVDKNSVLSTLDNLDSEHDYETIETLIDYVSMIHSAANPLLDLFRHFALSKKIQKKFTLKHVSCVMNKSKEIDSSKILSEKSFVKNNIIEHTQISEIKFEQGIKEMESIYPNSIENFIKYVSGKDYIIPYIIENCKKKLNKKFGLSKEEWKYQLCKYCDIIPLKPLKDAILKEVNKAG
jgi:hypothetical protein